MKAILVTGMSGAGKSTLLLELARRGHQTIDTDYNGWCTSSADRSELIWDETKMTGLLARESDESVIISGCVSNQRMFYDKFSSIVLLSAPAAVLMHRVMTRRNNDFGKQPEDQQSILNDIRDVEPRLRVSANVELDSTRSIEELADAVEALILSLV